MIFLRNALHWESLAAQVTFVHYVYFYWRLEYQCCYWLEFCLYHFSLRLRYFLLINHHVIELEPNRTAVQLYANGQ